MGGTAAAWVIKVRQKVSQPLLREKGVVVVVESISDPP